MMARKVDFDGIVVKRDVEADGSIYAYDKNGRICWDRFNAERVILTEDLRRQHDGCYVGRLGWTIPGKTDGYKSVLVAFDGGPQIEVKSYRLMRVLPERAVELARDMMEAHRGTSRDADPIVAHSSQLAEWRKQFAKTIDFDNVEEFGEGAEEVYAFTFPSLRRLAELEGRDTYPVKVGYTSGGRLYSVARIAGMLLEPTSYPERAVLLGVWRTGHGRGLETAVHTELRRLDRRVELSVGREWFNTNVAELTELLSRLSPATVAESEALDLMEGTVGKVIAGNGGVAVTIPASAFQVPTSEKPPPD